MERQWSMRAFKSGDEERILELWKAVYPEKNYHREKWMRWWRWMYEANPSGTGLIWLAEHQDKIVGQYAVVPIRMKMGSSRTTVALSLDTMTHPDYRRQGMFEALAKAVYAEAQARGIQMVYGFPNDQSYPGFMKKLQWFDIATLEKVVRPLDWQNTLKTQTDSKVAIALGTLLGGLTGTVLDKMRKAPRIEGLTIEQVRRFHEGINDLWARASGKYQIAVWRDTDHLNWRYADIPDAHYVLYEARHSDTFAGYLVLSLKQPGEARIGTIFDVFGESEKVIQCLMWEAVEHCRQQRVDLVYGARRSDEPLARCFANTGFVPAPMAKGIRLCGFAASPRAANDLVQNPDNWFVQLGDSDET